MSNFEKAFTAGATNTSYEEFGAIEQHDLSILNDLEKEVDFAAISSILTVGAGTGELEMSLLRKYPNLRLSYLDPSTNYHQQFVQKVNELQLGDRVTALVSSFEQFEQDQKYDLVLAVHVWYAFGYSQELLRKALGLLASGGELIIVLQSKCAPAFEICSLSTSLQYANLNAEDFRLWLYKNGVHADLLQSSNFKPLATFVNKTKGLTKKGKAYGKFLLWLSEEAVGEYENQIEEIFHRYAQDHEVDLKNGIIKCKN